MLSWLGADWATWLLQKLVGSRQHCFRGSHVLFATPARPPSDYVFENLSWSVWTRYWRKARVAKPLPLHLLLSLASYAC